MLPSSSLRTCVKLVAPANGFGFNRMRTRPSFISASVSAHASDLATSSNKSPFCSVQTLAAMSPLPAGMESFSFVPSVVHVTSFSAMNGLATLLESCAQSGIAKHAKNKNDGNNFTGNEGSFGMTLNNIAGDLLQLIF